VLRVTWQPPAHPRGPPTEIVYVVSWNSVNADGSRTEGRVETGTRLNKVIASRSLQGHGVHDDTSQHVLVSGLQPSRTYNIRVCVFFFHLLQIHKSVLHMTSSKCLLTFKTKLKTYIVLSFPPFFIVDCKVTAVPLACFTLNCVE